MNPTFLRQPLPVLAAFISFFVGLAAQAQITNPIGPEPQKRGLGVTMEQWVKIPNSDGQPPRLSFLRECPDGSGRFFVNDQRGYIWVILPNNDVELYLDLRAWSAWFNPKSLPEMGTIGLAFHPDFKNNGLFYTVGSAAPNSWIDFAAPRPIHNNRGEIVEPDHYDMVFEWSAGVPSSNSFGGSKRTLMVVEQPYRSHNMGEIAFHPTAKKGDREYGLLYLSVPDGGSDGYPVTNTDPLDVGQNTMSPLGSILRIDPLGRDAELGHFGIPKDNPFADGKDGVLPEIYAYGLRNPHRFNWARSNPDRLYAYDIGQFFIEEINLIKPGANYGWGNREGNWVLDELNEDALYPLPDNDDSLGYTYPIVMYDHPYGPGALAGGFIYRGDRMPDLRGRFLFADFTWGGKVFSAPASTTPVSANRIEEVQVYDGAGHPTTASFIIGGNDSSRTDIRFAEDSDGELYATNKHNGWIYKLRAAPGRGPGGGEEGPLGAAVIDSTSSYYESDWFGGFFAPPADDPWIYHNDHGWLALTEPPDDPDAAYYWDRHLGWAYTASGSYPWVYFFDLRTWAFYLRGTDDGLRWFYLDRRGEWGSYWKA